LRASRLAAGFFVATLACTLAPAALAEDAFYLGVWKIDSAVVGPWWNEPQKPDPAEKASLVGKTFVIKAKGITGPRQVACKDPQYKVVDYSALMLFQGAFEEMQMRDKSVDPAKVAAKLGFHGSSWKTLETGCGNEVDFHFLDPTTAAFGLNNYIYILKKQ
jgi:hypothetical protein